MEYPKIVKTDGLTDLEIKVLEAARHTGYDDCFDTNATWCFAIAETAGISMSVFRGVASSLIKKGFAKIWDWEGKGKPMDMVFAYTEAGKLLF
jgi:hypothetical protein